MKYKSGCDNKKRERNCRGFNMNVHHGQISGHTPPSIFLVFLVRIDPRSALATVHGDSKTFPVIYKQAGLRVIMGLVTRSRGASAIHLIDSIKRKNTTLHHHSCTRVAVTIQK